MRATAALIILLCILPAACGGGEHAAPPPSAWEACLRASSLAGVERETIPDLDLEVEGLRVVTGSLGQRGTDVDAAGDVLRIAAVGGELTFGVGLPAEQAWPQALARQLNHTILSAGKRVEALNLGTVGASASDVLNLARQRALAWQPWLMVVEIDSTRLGGATSADFRASFTELRKAAAEAHCGVLVAVSSPLGAPSGDTQRMLFDEAQRAGFSTLDLREVLQGEAGSAPTQERVLDAVKRRFYDSGLLTAALESH